MLYSEPKNITDPAQCLFYHVMDLPGGKTTPGGSWDLRQTVRAYLGDIDFQGKRVLELGTASGFLCFEMEKMGADVVAYDLSPDQQWDIPFSRDDDRAAVIRTNKKGIEKLNNGFWYAHQALGSKAKLAQGAIYDLSEDLGSFDVVTLCAILLHLRDPFLALERAAARSSETVLITELYPDWADIVKGPFARYVAAPGSRSPHGGATWWHFTPDCLIAMLQVLGFTDTTLTFHEHRFTLSGRMRRAYSIVARLP